MICMFVALSPAIGAVLGFIYGPSISRALARLFTQRIGTASARSKPMACKKPRDTSRLFLWYGESWRHGIGGHQARLVAYQCRLWDVPSVGE